ncbi:ferredoxin-NADP reductase [Pseudarthrobacter siccitolerans]|uniref:Ferredoxin-NADP reductase n=1 Tax=Pseudarthrobacter siccitolerans TaxID=861266 RepID=A0ABU0PL61_9MICC|nr:PDR/VanB family oxidoreductase [Pseudarthrobacter siccitolerans]MDQ0674709.1 ferredoxin-NADP reductase [Pseudarthrobacter siccitolerans]
MTHAKKSFPEHSTVNAQIVDIVNEAEGVVSLHLAPVEGSFPGWEPGAHIELNLAPDLIRQYSLCGDPQVRDRWRVGVLREPQSRGGSQFVHDKLSVGDVIECGSPLNNFELVDAKEYLFIAGGIGVTPILPMIAECEARGASWRMVYGGRNENSMAFRAEVAKYGDKVTMWPQDRFGIIDLKSLLTEPNDGLAVYCCGPGVLLDAVEGFCAQWPENTATLHLERFRPKAGALDGQNTAFEVVIDSSGDVLTVEADRSIAETLEAAGIHVPTSCREGTCGTCETGLLEGIPDHRDSYLTPEEKSSNEIIMLCCSRSCSKRLVLDL